MLNCTLVALGILALCAGPATATAAPTVAVLKQVLEARMQQLKPEGVKTRTLLFSEVRPGTASGGTYPFLVTGLIHDYGAGYPANRFYGETCLSKIERQRFDLSTDSFGAWQVQGRMTPSLADTKCEKNPAPGVSAIPLASLSGAPAPAGRPTSVPASAGTSNAGGLKMGEYACYGSGNRIMIGLGFKVLPGGRYTDLDGKNSGSYSINGSDVSFHSGHLGGQHGRELNNDRFRIGSMAGCEPF